MNVINNNPGTTKTMKENSDSDSDDSLSDDESGSNFITEEEKENQSEKSGELSETIEASNDSFSSYLTFLEEEECIVQVTEITNKEVHEVGTL